MSIAEVISSQAKDRQELLEQIHKIIIQQDKTAGIPVLYMPGKKSNNTGIYNTKRILF